MMDAEVAGVGFDMSEPKSKTSYVRTALIVVIA